MINLQIAKQMILEHLRREEVAINDFGSAWPQNQNRRKLHLVISEVLEYEFGWVFLYNSKEYLDTNDFQFSLVGNTPLIVSNEDGQIYQTGTNHPLEFFVEQFRQGIRTRA